MGGNILIFITVGSQKFQFNRLLKEIDYLIKEGKLDANKVFGQIGYSTYEPKSYAYKKFLDKEEFIRKIEECEIVITHGGTGSIISSIKEKKKVIAVPRNIKYKEHVDNHQFEIIEQFSNSGMIHAIVEVGELEDAISKIKHMEFKEYNSNTGRIINILEDFIKDKC